MRLCVFAYFFLYLCCALKRARNMLPAVVEVLQDVTGHERFYLAYNACRTRQRLRKDQRCARARRESERAREREREIVGNDSPVTVGPGQMCAFACAFLPVSRLATHANARAHAQIGWCRQGCCKCRHKLGCDRHTHVRKRTRGQKRALMKRLLICHASSCVRRRSEKSLKKLLDPQGAAAARIGKNQVPPCLSSRLLPSLTGSPLSLPACRCRRLGGLRPRGSACRFTPGRSFADASACSPDGLSACLLHVLSGK